MTPAGRRVVPNMMQVEIWSDVVCPWCYVGKRRFETALSRFPDADRVDVVWRSFELNPAAPPTHEGDYVTRLAAKYRVGGPEAQAMIDRMTAAGTDEGLDLRFDRARPGNTFDAHRLLHLARDRGVQDALKERLLSATFTEGRAIGDTDVLVDLATEVGMDRAEAGATLDGDAYAEDVRADEAQAARYGITAVPFFVVDRTYGVAGAQPAEVLLGVLADAWPEASRRRPLVSVPGEAPACDDDTCEV
jgi:predicted DsbA family dithiol-disulfide isomerase